MKHTPGTTRMYGLAIVVVMLFGIVATCAAQDEGGPVAELLTDSELQYTYEGDGNFAIPFENDITLYAHQYVEMFRAFTPLGVLPGDNPIEQGYWALEALRLNYSDPLGRLSLYQEEDDDDLDLFWECEVPMAAATGSYVESIALVGANQTERWELVTRNEDPGNIDDLYPDDGSGDEALLPQLMDYFGATDLLFEETEDGATVEYENGVTVFFHIYLGTVRTYAYSGGMPGQNDEERAEAAIELLKQNWNAPIGHLSLDDDDDLLWECQVPMDYLTPEFLETLCNVAAGQVDEVLQQFGEVPVG